MYAVLGWFFPTQKLMYCALLPEGREGEYMGIFALCGEIFSWAPSLLFSVIIQTGGGMRWAMASYSLFAFIAGAFAHVMGDPELAHSSL
jgi:MFS-type transporter involved in bile tolerance (Atg22 family)